MEAKKSLTITAESHPMSHPVSFLHEYYLFPLSTPQSWKSWKLYTPNTSLSHELNQPLS